MVDPFLIVADLLLDPADRSGDMLQFARFIKINNEVNDLRVLHFSRDKPLRHVLAPKDCHGRLTVVIQMFPMKGNKKPCSKKCWDDHYLLDGRGSCSLPSSMLRGFEPTLFCCEIRLLNPSVPQKLLPLSFSRPQCLALGGAS